MITDPSVWDKATDDFAPPVDQFQPNANPDIWWVSVFGGPVFMGLLMFYPDNTICWQSHSCLLPAAWGQAAVIGREAVRWLFANTSARRITAAIPAYNRLAISMAKRSGLVEFGRNPLSFQKRGTLHDQILLGVSK